jgi:hypothetical protein
MRHLFLVRGAIKRVTANKVARQALRQQFADLVLPEPDTKGLMKDVHFAPTNFRPQPTKQPPSGDHTNHQRRHQQK